MTIGAVPRIWHRYSRKRTFHGDFAARSDQHLSNDDTIAGTAPGFFGTFHFAANFALTTVYGVPEAESLAFAFAYHFGGWIPITAIGLWFAWQLGISIGDVGAAEDTVEEGLEELRRTREMESR